MEFLGDEEGTQKFKKLLLFSGNDYLGLSSHPTIGKAAAKVCLLDTTSQKISLIHHVLKSCNENLYSTRQR